METRWQVVVVVERGTKGCEWEWMDNKTISDVMAGCRLMLQKPYPPNHTPSQPHPPSQTTHPHSYTLPPNPSPGRMNTLRQATRGKGEASPLSRL